MRAVRSTSTAAARNNIEYCVVCHTDQRKFGRAEATYDAATRTFSGSTYKVQGRTVGSAPNFLHKLHVGGVMTNVGYNYGGVLMDKGGFSQDIRNCEKCHNPANTNTPQAALWKDNPNRQACGSCHDGINFDTGTGLTLGDKAKGLTTSTGFFGAAHPANAQDGGCSNASCHGAGSPGNPDLVHKPVTPPSHGQLPAWESRLHQRRQHERWLDCLQRQPASGRRDQDRIRDQERHGRCRHA